MKKMMITLCLLGFIMGGCKDSGRENNSIKERAESSGHYLNFDDKLDIKSSVKVDTIEFRKAMSTLLPTSRILELFGGGYQLFYLGLTIETDGKVFATLAPDAGWWVTGMGDVDRMLFKEKLEITKNYAIVPEDERDSKAIRIKDIFYFPRLNVEKAFSASPGMLMGKRVRSVKIFQIDATIDNMKNIIVPWSINEVDIAKFRPKIGGNLGKEFYMGFFPSVLKEDFKFIGQSMGFPTEARARGVRGKVLIKLFYEADGVYAGYQLLKGLGYGCEEVVVNTIENFKPKSYPSGQRSSVVVPFKFGSSDDTPVDFTAGPVIEENPKKYNNLSVKWYNKLKLKNPINSIYKVIIIIDNEMISASEHKALNGDNALWFHWKSKKKSGIYDYLISIDPENVLNDIDRSNNTVKGKIVIK